MIVLRTSFNGIPKALMESATIDGAGDGVVLFKIVLPLSMAALATITLFYAVGYWGAWYNAMIYLQKRRDLYPLQLFLRELLILDKGNEGYLNSMSGAEVDRYLVKEIMKYGIIMVGTVPVLLIYPFIQKYFVKGVMVGSLKG
jgi:putative aldouronate transport system permease protein